MVVTADWRKVKERLLFSLTNLGQPHRRTWWTPTTATAASSTCKHRFEGVPLDVEKARDTLKNLHRLWRRPVHLETIEDDERGRLLSFDGTEHKSVRL